MKNQPSDILVPYQLTCQEAIDAYCERLTILIEREKGNYSFDYAFLILKRHVR